MEFERAAALRDRIKALTQVQTPKGINPQGVSEADVIALHLDSGQACVQVFFIRANQNWGNRDYYPRVGPTWTRPRCWRPSSASSTTPANRPAVDPVATRLRTPI